MKPLISGIKLPSQDNQFKPMDFSTELNDQEKIISSQVKVDKIFPMIKKFDYLPTHTPTNFNEQFAIYNSKLYAYINGAWAALN